MIYFPMSSWVCSLDILTRVAHIDLNTYLLVDASCAFSQSSTYKFSNDGFFFRSRKDLQNYLGTVQNRRHLERLHILYIFSLWARIGRCILTTYVYNEDNINTEANSNIVSLKSPVFFMLEKKMWFAEPSAITNISIEEKVITYQYY